MTILVFGKNGQVGRALQQVLEGRVRVELMGRDDCDLTDLIKLRDLLEKISPQVIINASAYTSVDQAESNLELAFAINKEAVAEMAQYMAKKNGGLLIHFSTDYVFFDSQVTPYREVDRVASMEQLGGYASSKLAGEKVIINTFEESRKSNIHSSYVILRTSWVYGDGVNFIQTILQLAREKQKLNVVSDQVGTPTSANFLAKLVFEIVGNHQKAPADFVSKIYHAVACGVTSWHGLASYVVSMARDYDFGLCLKPHNIYPIQARDYSCCTIRPYNSQLHNHELQQYFQSFSSTTEFFDWQKDVKEYVKNLLLEKKVDGKKNHAM